MILGNIGWAEFIKIGFPVINVELIKTNNIQYLTFSVRQNFLVGNPAWNQLIRTPFVPTKITLLNKVGALDSVYEECLYCLHSVDGVYYGILFEILDDETTKLNI